MSVSPYHCHHILQQYPTCTGASRPALLFLMPSHISDKHAAPVEASLLRPPVSLYPPLGAPDELADFTKSGRALSFALSPRGNSFNVYETTVRWFHKWPWYKISHYLLSQKDLISTSTMRSRVMYFAQWEKIRNEDAEVRLTHYLS